MTGTNLLLGLVVVATEAFFFLGSALWALALHVLILLLEVFASFIMNLLLNAQLAGI